MAAELIRTEEALDDIDAIAQFIARNSPHHARRVVGAMFELSDAIGEQPMIGRIVPNCRGQSSESGSSTATGCYMTSAASASPLWW